MQIFLKNTAYQLIAKPDSKNGAYLEKSGIILNSGSVFPFYWQDPGETPFTVNPAKMAASGIYNFLKRRDSSFRQRLG
jgi:hypothetical protein